MFEMDAPNNNLANLPCSNMYLVLHGKGLLLIHGWLTANHSCYIKCVTMRTALQTTYSLRPKLWTNCCFMKQNCQLLRGIAQHKNATTPLASKGIHATH